MEWKNKIDQFRATPPPLVWDEIEKEISQNEQSFYNYAATPPENSWNEISAKLMWPQDHRMRAVRKLFRPVLRYAAMIAFMALIGTIIFNKPFRNAVIETFQGPGMKASLIDTPHVNKNDTSTNDVRHTQFP